VKFNPKDPSTWRSGAGKAAMNAVEANDVEELKVCVCALLFRVYISYRLVKRKRTLQ
jgi:hypothetical protein